MAPASILVDVIIMLPLMALAITLVGAPAAEPATTTGTGPANVPMLPADEVMVIDGLMTAVFDPLCTMLPVAPPVDPPPADNVTLVVPVIEKVDRLISPVTLPGVVSVDNCTMAALMLPLRVIA